MGNRLCCGGGWSCPSTLPNKKKTGSQEKWTLRMHQEQLQQNGTQGRKITRRTYKQVSWHETRERSQSIPVEDSSLHYADIQLCSRTQPRPAHEVKHLENTTEYATLRFPQGTPRYDSKNGTLV
ncbi:uncharacterized protein C11orf52 homolog isoform X2 [Otolemur garnettii]|uniref:uncharacterized protein C11orf52 homolog isoform X2 n=1 Tax=Otolemur garnettii TaxID=30611 RepID=UPI000151362B|nr:uncharacterized protein C11orf52 homolog isoform X2 [Otolemur garnettii]